MYRFEEAYQLSFGLQEMQEKHLSEIVKLLIALLHWSLRLLARFSADFVHVKQRVPP